MGPFLVHHRKHLGPFLVLRVRLAVQPGKHGVGTIAEGKLDPDLLDYLKTCPSWMILAKQRLET